ncbi:heavy metal translocating P-type ATPase [Sphingorhabdus lacus]|uniref:P-type Zn(2+) transporter n=1 Tax=Sphingorhabdus lacus TaxID=392610 RepID=A0A6I6L3A4_9SPHN|nr:heavy metal translocating P-type ATPase [Sphingorhabdus lacus]QGY80215.1 heavy metal translocating P-type ATPase [Sphingorhabdus lacus]
MGQSDDLAVEKAHSDDDGHAHGVGQSAGLRIFLFACAVAAISYGISWLRPEWSPWAYGIGAVISVAPFARTAFTKALKGRPFSIETLMTIAVLGAIPIEAGAEAVVVVVLFSLGELLEGFAAARARSGLNSLAKLLPSQAVIEVDGERRTVDVTTLAIGSIMLVSAGDRIAADGRIIDGRSEINEAAITGESRPVEKSIAADVFAGSINGDGTLKVEVTKDASNSVVARIGELVAQAQESTAPTARFIDNFSAYYTPAAIILATLIALVPPLAFGGEWATWTYRALTVLLIACPCALVLSTPAAIATGIATAARSGILIKSGEALEMLAKIGIAAFDKTGTLTRGHPVVTDVAGVNTLELASAIETGLTHPVAKAIVTEAERLKIAVPKASDVTIRQGEGAIGMVGSRQVALFSPRAAGALAPDVAASIDALERAGKTIAVLLVDGKYQGHIAVRDEARDDARPAVAALNAIGIRSLMLSGDNQRTATAVAQALGMEAEGELMPADKLKRIEALKAEAPVLMVGDGVNDAPALATASLGLAMGGGTDVAIETADIGLLKDRLWGVPDAIRLARKTRRTIMTNIVIAVGLKLVFLVLAVFGITNLWTAIIADTGATILVTFNALLLFWTFRPTIDGSTSAPSKAF